MTPVMWRQAPIWSRNINLRHLFHSETPQIINDVQRSWTKLTHGRLAQLMSAYNESQLIIRPDIPPSACVRAPHKMARSTKAFDA